MRPLLIALVVSSLGCEPPSSSAGATPEAAASTTDELTESFLVGSAPVALRTGPRSIDFFAGDLSGTLWTRRLDENTRQYSAWQPLTTSASAMGSALTGAVDTAGQVRLFSRHVSLNTVMTILLGRSGASWAVVSPWRSLWYPGLLAFDSPAATMDPSGVIHLFSSDRSTNALIHTSCILAANCTQATPLWAPWATESLRIFSAPSVVSSVTGEFDLAFRDRLGTVKLSRFRDFGPPYVPGWSTPQSLGLDQPLPTFFSSTTLAADWTPSLAVVADTAQGIHSLRNVWINPFGGSLAQGTCGGLGPEGVVRLDLPTNSYVHVDTNGVGYDTVLYLRDSSGAEVVDTAGTRACNDDVTPAVRWSSLDLTLRAGTYYLFVDGYSLGGGANAVPPVNVTIRSLSAPALVARASAGAPLLDVYSVEGSGQLVANTRNSALTWAGAMPIDAIDFQVDGDLSTTDRLSAVASSLRTACSVVTGRVNPSRKAFTKGCGESAAFTIENEAGTRASPPFVIARPDAPLVNVWGQINSAWNQSHDFGAAGTSPAFTRTSFTARWPSELMLFDFDDSHASILEQWDFLPHGSAALSGRMADTVGVVPDFGEQVTARYLWMPGGVKSARLVDHGSCVTRVSWENDLLLQVVAGVKTEMAQSLREGLNKEKSTDLDLGLESITFIDAKASPAFMHYNVDPVTGNHSDGFAFKIRAMASGAIGGFIAYDYDLGGRAQYVLGLDKGRPVVTHLINTVQFDPDFFPSTSDPKPDSECQQRDVGANFSCQLAQVIPHRLNDAFAARTTAMFGDPMAAKSCTTSADCGTKPFSPDPRDTWVCHNNRCLVPILEGQAGYVAGGGEANFRTEFDNGDFGRALLCTPPEPGQPLHPSSIGNCQQQLVQILKERSGLSEPLAQALATEASMVTNEQFGCVKPKRPGCDGDKSIPGYVCHDPALNPVAGNEQIIGRCTWRPAFKRLNVLPEHLELVWSDDGPSVSERIVQNLSPGSMCRAPTSIESSSVQPLPVVDMKD